LTSSTLSRVLVAIVAIELALTVMTGVSCRSKPEDWSRSRIAEPQIRVRVAGPAQTIPLAIDGPFSVFDAAQKKLGYGAYLPRTVLGLSSNAVKIGESEIPIEDYVDFVPERKGSVQIDDRTYGGKVRLHRLSDGTLLAVNYVRVEEYLKGVLPAELPRTFAFETYKAQAIAARTYALYEKFSRPGDTRLYDVMASEGSQVYKGRDVQTSQSDKAVDQTQGIVLVRDTPRGSKIFPAYFSSTCGGQTQPARFLAAKAPDCPPLAGNVTCTTCVISPRHHWSETRLSADELTQQLNARQNTNFQKVDQITVLEAFPYGRMTKVRVTDITGQSVDLPAERFRLIAGPRTMLSTWCRIRKDGNIFVFYDGHGWGHGVGMCQWGAEGMARQGNTGVEILMHYFPKANLVRAY